MCTITISDTSGKLIKTETYDDKNRIIYYKDYINEKEYFYIYNGDTQNGWLN